MRATRLPHPLRPDTAAPYVALGADELSSYIWKTATERGGWQYDFNLFRVGTSDGRVHHTLRPSDLLPLVKLIRLLAAVLTDDGCLDTPELDRLRRLEHRLDDLLTHFHED